MTQQSPTCNGKCFVTTGYIEGDEYHDPDCPLHGIPSPPPEEGRVNYVQVCQCDEIYEADTGRWTLAQIDPACPIHGKQPESTTVASPPPAQGEFDPFAKCLYCDGKGEVEHGSFDVDGTPYLMACEECHSTGYLIPVQAIQALQRQVEDLRRERDEALHRQRYAEGAARDAANRNATLTAALEEAKKKAVVYDWLSINNYAVIKQAKYLLAKEIARAALHPEEEAGDG